MLERVGFCTECNAAIASWEGLSCCPSCGTTSIPCAVEGQVTVSVNWHELRVLIIWAENWQRQHQLGRTVYAIAQRLAAQHPDRAKATPLTLAGELGQLAQQFGDVQTTNADLRRDVAEQTGEELGLITPQPKEEPGGD